MASPVVPDWMSRDFFQSCLQSRETQPLTVTNHTVKLADIADGNNYGSQLFQAKVDYSIGNTTSSISLILKGPVANIQQFIGEIYEKEVKFYTEFVNETYKYSKHDLLPKHYTSPHPVCVVLEDLKPSCYVMVDRHKFLDLQHCQLVIKAKAKLHALSVAIYKHNPEMIESLVKESPIVVENKKKMTKTMVEGSLRCMIAYLEDNLNNKEYMDIINEEIKDDNMWKMYQEVENSCSNKTLRALIQLDPWCTNMMFKYDSLGKVENVKLLDFQALAFTSPLQEIVTFLSICPNMNVRKTNLNDLYHLYIHTLNESLAELGCTERLNYEEVKAEVVTMGPMVLFLTCSGVPILLAEEAADINEYLSGNILNAPVRESPIYKLYQSKTVNTFFPQFLDAIAREGIFDYIKEKLKQMIQQ